MAHGSTHLQARETPGFRHGWFAALRRGVIVGLVASLHLGLLVLLFGPVTPRWPRSDSQREQHDALSIRLVTVAAEPLRASAISRRRTPVRLFPRKTSATMTVTDTTAVPAPSAATVAPQTAIGDYHSPLLGGRSGMAVSPTIPRLPGSDAARVQGITLQASSSLQQVVRAMTKGSRCKYTRMKMAGSANQFVTAQLMDRALEADGCGPQVPHTADDRAVEAISHQAIFGD
jgi:hypothetical protein